jgi:hypothetical protein
VLAVRLIRPRKPVSMAPWGRALALATLLVGCLALVMMAVLPIDRIGPLAALGVVAALGIGIGLAWLVRSFGGRRAPDGEDIARLLAPAFDDSYVLLLNPRLPDVPKDLAALLVGPAGVRALVARRWRGRYRVRGRGWEYDTHSSAGYIPCRTNPTFDAETVVQAVQRWAHTAADEPALPAAAAVAFPRSWSVVVLEEPEGEVVTSDNAPWWAHSIGRVQRMDAARVTRFVQSVIDAGDASVAHGMAPAHQR